MQDVTLVGIDLGKHSFHLHGQDRHGKGVFRRKVGRKQLIEFFATFHACTVVMEACAGAHYMARKLADFGYRRRLRVRSRRAALLGRDANEAGRVLAYATSGQDEAA